MNTFLKITIVSAGIAAAAAFWVGTQRQEPEQRVVVQAPLSTVSFTPVLTVLNSADAGTLFSELVLGRMDVRTDQLSEQFIIDTPEAAQVYASRILTRGVTSGAPLLTSDFIAPGTTASSQLRNSLRSGMRAISLQVSPETAVAGLILPGDTVDVISTRRSETSELQSSILIRGSRVLAIDQTVAQPDPGSPLPPPATITLEVLPEGATAISLARELGTLSVVISTADNTSEVLPEDGALRTTADMFSQPGKSLLASNNEAEATVVIRRGVVAETSRVLRGK